MLWLEEELVKGEVVLLMTTFGRSRLLPLLLVLRLKRRNWTIVSQKLSDSWVKVRYVFKVKCFFE